MDQYANEDLSKVGISERGYTKLKRLQEEKHFIDMRDAYRFGIALALANGIRPPDVLPPKVSLYNISQIDPDQSISITINLLMDAEGIPPYRWVERLAEWGVDELFEASKKGSIDFVKILADAKAKSETL